jgi:endoglucanase
MRLISTIAWFLFSILGVRILFAVESSSLPAVAVRLNSVGYLPDSKKLATVVGDAKGFVVREIETGAEVIDGPLLPIEGSGKDSPDLLADFSAVKREGVYELKIRGGAESSTKFLVREHVYSWPFYCVFRAMYLSRCGTEVFAESAGRHYEHAACHLEDAYLDYVDGPKGKQHDAIGGWHDAGDYNKYAVNAAFTVGTMLKAWEHFRQRLAPLTFDIPESGNQTPDFLDEVRWELNWLLKMQAADGRVHHKVSALKYSGFVLPEQDTARRYLSSWSSAATADFAAVMAEASRAFLPFDAKYSSRCLTAAKKSYEFLRTNPKEHRPDLSAFSTGGYEAPDADDRLWAAAELWEATGEARYLHDCEQRVRELELVKGKDSACVDIDWDWGNLRNLGVFTYLLSVQAGRDSSIVADVRRDVLQAADKMVATARQHPYGRPLGSIYHWGCNGTVARQTMNLHVAYRLTGNQRYRDTMLDAVNYLFGRNSFGRSFVTGLGHRPPMHPHDRRSGGDKVDAPWPGYLVGGAWPNETNWSDDEADYRTNEIAINWNGALIYALAGFVEAQRFDESVAAARNTKRVDVGVHQ